jgi:HEAT repeat protein
MNKLAATIVIAALTTACGGPPEGARRAQRALNAGEFDRAEQIADAELARFPKQPTLWRVKMLAALGRRDASRAVGIYGDWKQLRGGHDTTALRAMAKSTLWQALHTPSRNVRIAAIQTAERLDMESMADPVSERLGDDDPAVAAAAAVAILRWHPDAPYVATQSLSSDDPRARAIAVEGIARKAGGHARDDLAPLLTDRDDKVRRAAIGALWKFASPEDIHTDVDTVVRLARADEVGSVRAAALRALSQKDFPGALELARASLRDDYLGARLAALQLLADRGGDPASDDLKVVAAGDDLFMALRATVLLAKRGFDGNTLAVARRALAAESWSVRAAAMNAIAQVAGKDDGLPVVRATIDDEAVHVRLSAARALIRFGAPDEALPVLAAALADDSDSARVQAAIDLIRLEDARGTTALDSLVRSPSPDTREQAVRAMIQLREPTDGLVAALADENAEVRIAAADVILTILE